MQLENAKKISSIELVKEHPGWVVVKLFCAQSGNFGDNEAAIDVIAINRLEMDYTCSLNRGTPLEISLGIA